MSTYQQTITYLLASIEHGECKGLLSSKLHDWFSGKDFDVESALEWVKNQRGLSDLNRASVGLALSFIRPREDVRRRRFIIEPLSSVGTTETKKKGIDLATRRLPKVVSFHEAMELAEGFSPAAMMYCLRELYINPRSQNTAVKLGVLSALCEHEAGASHRAVGKTSRSRIPEVRKENERVKAEATSRLMGALATSDEVREMSEGIEESIRALRTLGSQAGKTGIAKDALEMLKTSGMGNQSLLNRHLK
uniref:Matrix protein 1 n=1 Tax=Salamander influenza-like virus TaxID=2777034 RepID=A0A866VZI9_9ORTO|nr:matrix protein 1 [Salamander influenza-like virus]